MLDPSHSDVGPLEVICGLSESPITTSMLALPLHPLGDDSFNVIVPVPPPPH
jgi:hypothetical protein